MDLLRLVLVRLPIDRLTEFQEVIDKNFILDRIRVVNRIDEEIGPFDEYVRLCMLQGEISTRFPSVLNYEWVSCRASFLADFETSEGLRLTGSCPNIGLRSSDPRIRSHASLRYTTDGIVDPASIAWTSEMRKGVLSRFEWDMMNFAIGYISYLEDASVSPAQLPVNLPGSPREPAQPKLPSVTSKEPMLAGYVNAVMQEASDPFAPIPWLEKLARDFLPERYEIILVENGYHYMERYSEITVTKAIQFIWPKLLIRSCREQLATLMPIIESYWISGNMDITEGLVGRAKEMLDLDLNFSDFYRLLLRIIVGLPVDLSTVHGCDYYTLVIFMIRVAHPQLTKDLTDGMLLFWKPTLIAYDLVNYFRVYSDDFPSRDSDGWYKLQILCANGQAFRLRGTKIFDLLCQGK